MNTDEVVFFAGWSVGGRPGRMRQVHQIGTWQIEPDRRVGVERI